MSRVMICIEEYLRDETEAVGAGVGPDGASASKELQ